ncbi:MAG TPA: SAF domain-containing protein [Myxococcaceae bacterium]|nr:SAF domain-containing protein [Myxococcaceae bacterium]
MRLSVGLGLGLGLGLGIGLAVSLVFNHRYRERVFKTAFDDARRGWVLKPSVVAATDLPAGALITFDSIAERKVPEQFVTPNAVEPKDAQGILGKRLLVSLEAGELVSWSAFAAAADPEVCEWVAEAARMRDAGR